MIAHKTKAAMPGRLSHNALLKHCKITRHAAGGQVLSDTVIAVSKCHLQKSSRVAKIKVGFQTLPSGWWGYTIFGHWVIQPLNLQINLANWWNYGHG